MTNFEYIQKLDIDGMASILKKMPFKTELCVNIGHSCVTYKTCEECMKIWLQQDIKDGKLSPPTSINI